MGEAFLFLDVDMERPETLPFADGEVAVLSRRAPGAQRPNEDAALVYTLPGGGVLAVADGAGGHPAGGAAARLAVETLAEVLGEKGEGRALREAVLEGLERANRRVVALGGGAASTVAVALLEDGTLRSLHVGDSAVFVVGGKGRIKFQTVDHSPAGYAVEAGLVLPDEALHHEGRHVLVNHLGSVEMRVDVSAPLALAARDRLLVTTDGLHDNLYGSEIAALVRRGGPTSAADALAAAAAQRMAGGPPGTPAKPDDLTLILFRRHGRSKRSRGAEGG